MFRVVCLDRRGLAGLLLGLAVLASVLVGVAGAASSTNSARISAHLTKTSFTATEASSVKLVYKFSKPSKSFSYRLTVKQGSKWQTVKSVRKKGAFKGSKTTTVKKFFAGKPIKDGSYRLMLSADANRVSLSFRVTLAVPSPIKLSITMWPSGETGPSDTYTLDCPGGTGTLPQAASACAELSQFDASVFDPVPGDVGCTQNYGGPQVARVTGRFYENSIDAVFDLYNGCQIERWQKLSFLFPLDASLSITVWPSGKSGTQDVYTLECPRGSGTLPAAASACAKLSRLGTSAFSSGCDAQDPSGNGGPQLAQVTGDFAEESVDDAFNRANDCEIARWNALSFLFPLEGSS
jgi:hypothetical protein